MEQGVVIALTALGSFFAGLQKDIVVDWVRGGRRTPEKIIHPDDNTQCTDHAERLREAEVRINKNEKELERGSAKFEQILKSLKRVEETLAVLADRAKMRRKEDDE